MSVKDLVWGSLAVVAVSVIAALCTTTTVPTEVEPDDYTDPVDLTEPNPETVVVDRRPAGFNVRIQTEQKDIYWVPLQTQVNQIQQWRIELSAIGLDPCQLFDPALFSGDVHAYWRMLVNAANGYAVELAFAMELIISNEWRAADGYLFKYTRYGLEDLVGTDAYAQLRAWSYRPTSLTLEGNLRVLVDWAATNHLDPDTTFKALRSALRRNPGTERLVHDCAQHLTAWLDDDCKPEQLLEAIEARCTPYHDGGVGVVYASIIPTMSDNDLIKLVSVLGKYKLTPKEIKEYRHVSVE